MSRREDFATGVTHPALFHGTRRDFPYVPDMVLPASAVGHANWEDYYREKGESWRAERVFASPAEGNAWSWGSMMAHKQGGGRPRVHEVELADPVNRDEELGLPPGGTATSLGTEYHGKYARILRTHWAPPPSAGGWTQPSLPPMNWEPLGGRHWDHSELAAERAKIAEEKKRLAPKYRTHQPGEGQGKLF